LLSASIASTSCSMLTSAVAAMGARLCLRSLRRAKHQAKGLGRTGVVCHSSLARAPEASHDTEARSSGHSRSGPAKDGQITERSVSADIQRSKLFDMPKNIEPHLEFHQRRYTTNDKVVQYRDLVVCKAKDSKWAVKRATHKISKCTKNQSKVLRMMRYGRENFGRDIVSERSRGGLRAFRYRSGMRDLRHEAKFRRVEQRLPDMKRKRHRWMQLRKKRANWIGGGRYKMK